MIPFLVEKTVNPFWQWAGKTEEKSQIGAFQISILDTLKEEFVGSYESKGCRAIFFFTRSLFFHELIIIKYTESSFGKVALPRFIPKSIFGCDIYARAEVSELSTNCLNGSRYH